MFQEKDISVSGWFVFLLLSGIPGVNLLLWIILLVGEKTNKSLKNLMVLQLILVALGIVVYFLFFVLLIASFGSVSELSILM